MNAVPFSCKLLVLLLSLQSSALIAQTLQPYVPPDYYGDEHEGTTVLRHNSGQVLDTEGEQRPDIKAYFENAPIGIYLRSKSTISFTLAAEQNDTTLQDTLFRVDLGLSKNRGLNPILLYPAPGIANYYKGDIAAENVPADYRGMYKSIEDSIDCHIYGSSGGPRIGDC